jgi:hypothetical protein
LNFILAESTFLRYYCPLVIEGNKRGIKSIFFISSSGKYNCCLKKENYEKINDFCLKNNVEIKDLAEIKNFPGLTFLVEGVKIESTSSIHTTVSITYMTDFSLSYDSYIEKVDYVVLPSRFFAERYNKISNKNLYLGSPKYDINLSDNQILEKYNLTKKRKALVVFPRIRDLGKIDINKIYSVLNSMDYEILIKTRGKDPIPQSFKGGKCFEDDSWFPHTTMELIKVSNFVINFGSTSIKECVLMKTPVINFDIKPFPLVLEELYNFGYCENFSKDVDAQKLENSIKKLTESNLDDYFNDAIKKFLFVPGSSSSKILDRFN